MKTKINKIYFQIDNNDSNVIELTSAKDNNKICFALAIEKEDLNFVINNLIEHFIINNDYNDNAFIYIVQCIRSNGKLSKFGIIIDSVQYLI